MKVLLSIKPKFALKIFEGTKSYEYRRRIFKRAEVTTIVVYASTPIKKVIGEFKIDGIIEEEILLLWKKTRQKGGISKEEFIRYFKDKTKGYAIKVGDSVKYDVPKLLNDLDVGSPPQSFTYLGRERGC